MGKSDYERGYNTGYTAAKRGQKWSPNYAVIRPSEPRDEVIAYGLTRGQMEVIKMQVKRFNASYYEIAKRYGATVNAIKQTVESVQFADIKARGKL